MKQPCSLCKGEKQVRGFSTGTAQMSWRLCPSCRGTGIELAPAKAKE